MGKTNELPNLYATIISYLRLFRSLVSIKLSKMQKDPGFGWAEKLVDGREGEEKWGEITIFGCLVTRDNGGEK